MRARGLWEGDNSVIQLDQVSKSYAGRCVLQPTSLQVMPGQTVSLVGQSGSGKSTVLRIVLGLIRPDGGSVALNGAPLTPGNARRLRHGAGYVIQDGGLFPHLTAADNVVLLARHLGWDAGRRTARVRELAEMVRLPEDALGRYPQQLSGGQRQRVGLMRALMLDPPVLLLDEPLGALDPLTRAELQRELRALFSQLRKTVLLVTHDLGEAAYFGGNIGVMHAGRLLQLGTLCELREAPADPYVPALIAAQQQAALTGTAA